MSARPLRPHTLLRGAPLAFTLLAAFALLHVPAGVAHNAAPAPEQYTRFLSDCSDDWGGHSAVRDGHDLVALDLTERWIAEANEPGLFVLLTMGFGFAETGSQGGPLHNEIDMTGPKGASKVRLSTDDNKEFTADAGAGLTVPDVILPPRPSLLPNGAADGSRFLLEYGFRYSKLGLAIGDTITRINVQAFARQDRGDFMPGGYYLLGASTGGERDCPQSGHQGPDPGSLYIRKDYTLRGPEAPFLDVRLNTDALAVSGNQSAFLAVTVQNKISKQAQRVVVSGHHPTTWDSEVEPAFALVPADGSTEFALRIHAPGAAGNTTLLVAVDSDAGGHATRSIPLYWYPPGVEATIPSPQPTNGSPAPSALLLLVLAAVVGLGIHRGRRTT